MPEGSDGDKQSIPLRHPEIFAAAAPGQDLLIDDGRVRVRVVDLEADALIAQVITGGVLSNRKGVNLPGGALGFLLVSAVAFIILGSVLEGIPAIVLFGPLLFPIARSVGVHEVHYSMVVILAMGVGLFAPPFGVGYCAACAISRIHPDAGVRPIVGYMLAPIVGLAVIIFVPWFSIGFL